MKKVHVVPHSHWDREWYFTIEDSNSLLVEHMDYLIKYLEENKEYPHFIFDGQLSIIEEYLKYRPENEERLKNLILEKRIFVGPWYTQCDSLNPKIESVIRNLQYGIHLGNKYGHTMNVGYLPDAFGQNAYLPSIFKRCGLEYSIMQRGIANEDAQNGINFIWKSPNGDIIKTNYIYFGYGPGKFLEATREYIDVKLKPMLDKLSDMSENNDLLLPSGGDQALIRTHFTQTTKQITELNKDYELIMSNYEEFMESVTFNNEHVIMGEHYTPQKSRIHRTIHSQRADLKILNLEVEKKLIEILEPLIAMAYKLGISVNMKLIDEVWKKLFDVHAHDSIAGCNSDATNRRIITRLESLEATIDGQINIIKKKITKMVAGEDNVLLIFNFAQISSKKVRCKIYSKEKNFKLLDEDKEVDFDIINFKEIDGGSRVEVTAQGEKQVKLPPYYETEIELNLDFESVGYQTFNIVEQDSKEEILFKDMKLEVNSVENDYLIVRTNLENEIIIESKDNEEKVKLAFEIQTDIGDSYDFAFVPQEEEVVVSKVDNFEVYENVKEKKVQYISELQLDNKIIKVNTLLTLHNDSKVLNIKHNICNNEQNIRVRSLFIKEIKAKNNFADQGFGIVKRENTHKDINTWKEKGYVEMPLSIYPFERFFMIDNLSIINSNVKEYEILEEAVALTLYRSVEVLGRDDLSTRPGRASGINNVVVQTKDARLIGHNFTFEYNISLTEVITNIKEIVPYELYEEINKNYDYYQNQKLNLFENRIDRFEMPINSKTLPKKYELFNCTQLGSVGTYISNIRLSFDNKVQVRLFNPHNGLSIGKVPKGYKSVNLTSNKVEKLQEEAVILTFDYETIEEE